MRLTQPSIIPFPRSTEASSIISEMVSFIIDKSALIVISTNFLLDRQQDNEHEFPHS
jgi:hypothetical protein